MAFFLFILNFSVGVSFFSDLFCLSRVLVGVEALVPAAFGVGLGFVGGKVLTAGGGV